MESKLCKTVEEYVQVVGPHYSHSTVRTDKPWERLMGVLCKDHQVEALIAIADFRQTGDLPRYEELLDPYLPPDERSKKKA